MHKKWSHEIAAVVMIIAVFAIGFTNSSPFTGMVIKDYTCNNTEFDYEITHHGIYRYNTVCFAVLFVKNNENVSGRWSFSYTFNKNGKEIKKPPLTREIDAHSDEMFMFELTCLENDNVTGYYNLTAAPTKAC